MPPRATARAVPRHASRRAEARFFYLSAMRELGDARCSTSSLTRALVTDFPDSSWSEEALNNLGTYYIVTNEDDLAAQAFKELFEKFPSGQHARARRRGSTAGGRYKTGNYAETVRVFEARGGDLPALRLPSAVSVLGGARARTAGRARHGGVAAAAGLHRLRELVLRPARAQAARVAAGGARRCRPRTPCRAGQPDQPADPRPLPSCRRPRRSSGSCSPPACTTMRSSELRYAQRAWGTLAGDRSDDGVGVSPEGRPAPRHHT